MHIKFVEIQNFRKLKSVRIDFATEKTVFVGANNSGKTSAMVALRHFLVDPKRITTNDFTLSNVGRLVQIGASLENPPEGQTEPSHLLSEWLKLLPSLDVWIEVETDEIHHVTHLLPTLDWVGGVLGVRLRLEPKAAGELARDYLVARKAAKETMEEAKKVQGGDQYTISLWPENIRDFLDRRIGALLTVKAHLLDATKLSDPTNGVANPQVIPQESEPIEGHPFEGLICVDEINAQRGFSDVRDTSRAADSAGDEMHERGDKRRLSEQLRSYYSLHLDPSEAPEPSDIDALQAIDTAQSIFDEKLKVGFAGPLKEMEGLGYPGVSDPKLILSTRIRPIDGLSHAAALQFQVNCVEAPENQPHLPEQYCGLGYQNLISMVFRLMSFRDAWMRVGKAKAKPQTGHETGSHRAPLHLVLIEEPEAHLHAQVQQVFIRKAYEILRAHPDLGGSKILTTQLLVSTHSSHIAHESEFVALRYFRRRPAVAPGEVPTSVVINLSEVFGVQDDTRRFVTRYLRAMHCDLFFADAAVLVEGPAERILVPHFIRSHFRELNQSYITLLEIGGSHAHRLRPLIEHLGLITLIIADIDASQPSNGGAAEQPKRGTGQISRNETVKTWTPAIDAIDALLECPEAGKERIYDELFSVRSAYQCPIITTDFNGGADAEALANTFEDALVFSNIPLFRDIDGIGLIPKFKKAVNDALTPAELGEKLFNLLKGGDKAAFALDILFQEDPALLHMPKYIADGLAWLEERIKRKQAEVVAETVAAIAAVAEEVAAVAPVDQ